MKLLPPTAILAAALVIVSTAADAQRATPLTYGDPQLALVTKDESDHRNIPNFRFDRTHTAGGFFQITDTNWRYYAPLVDIDLGKYPNAMSAPEELQGQVAGRMKADNGLMPWTCCNRVLRDHLASGNYTLPSPTDGKGGTQKAAAAAIQEPTTPPRHVWHYADGTVGPQIKPHQWYHLINNHIEEGHE